MPNLVDLKIPSPNLPDVGRFLKAAEALTIASAQDSVDAQEIRARVNTQAKGLDEQRLEVKRPMLEAMKRLDALFKTPIDTLEAAVAIFDRKILAWDQAQEELRKAEQAELDRKADIERERLESLRQKALARGDTAKAEQFEDRAIATVAPVVEAKTARAAGVSVVKRWGWKLLDAAKLNRPFLMPNDTKIGKQVTALGPEAIEVIGPGSIEIKEERHLSSRRS